jgi:hypothetical protein
MLTQQPLMSRTFSRGHLSVSTKICGGPKSDRPKKHFVNLLSFLLFRNSVVIFEIFFLFIFRQNIRYHNQFVYVIMLKIFLFSFVFVLCMYPSCMAKSLTTPPPSPLSSAAAGSGSVPVPVPPPCPKNIGGCATIKDATTKPSADALVCTHTDAGVVMMCCKTPDFAMSSDTLKCSPTANTLGNCPTNMGGCAVVSASTKPSADSLICKRADPQGGVLAMLCCKTPGYSMHGQDHTCTPTASVYPECSSIKDHGGCATVEPTTKPPSDDTVMCQTKSGTQQGNIAMLCCKKSGYSMDGADHSCRITATALPACNSPDMPKHGGCAAVKPDTKPKEDSIMCHVASKTTGSVAMLCCKKPGFAMHGQDLTCSPTASAVDVAECPKSGGGGCGTVDPSATAFDGSIKCKRSDLNPPVIMLCCKQQGATFNAYKKSCEPPATAPAAAGPGSKPAQPAKSATKPAKSAKPAKPAAAAKQQTSKPAQPSLNPPQLPF